MNIEAMIVDLADDDYTGLWELVWRARTITPSAHEDELIAQLRSALNALIHEGRLALFLGTQFIGEEKVVSAADVPTMLLASNSWEPPANGELHLRVLTTQPGP